MTSSTRPKVLIFGANGAIGHAMVQGFFDKAYEVCALARHQIQGETPLLSATWIFEQDLEKAIDQAVDIMGCFDAVVWAQGKNLNDSIFNFDHDKHQELYEANCLFVLRSLNYLLDKAGLKNEGSRLCVISSVWQERARPEKLSYAMTKAALGALVRCCALDLGPKRHLINAVLPGPIDTPMTRSQLSEVEIAKIAAATPFEKLVDLHTIVLVALMLCDSENHSLTGQSLKVDLGFSVGYRL